MHRFKIGDTISPVNTYKVKRSDDFLQLKAVILDLKPYDQYLVKTQTRGFDSWEDSWVKRVPKFESGDEVILSKKTNYLGHSDLGTSAKIGTVGKISEIHIQNDNTVEYIVEYHKDQNTTAVFLWNECDIELNIKNNKEENKMSQEGYKYEIGEEVIIVNGLSHNLIVGSVGKIISKDKGAYTDQYWVLGIQSSGNNPRKQLLTWNQIRPIKHHRYLLDMNNLVDIKSIYDTRIESGDTVKLSYPINYSINKDKVGIWHGISHSIKNNENKTLAYCDINELELIQKKSAFVKAEPKFKIEDKLELVRKTPWVKSESGSCTGSEIGDIKTVRRIDYIGDFNSYEYLMDNEFHVWNECDCELYKEKIEFGDTVEVISNSPDSNGYVKSGIMTYIGTQGIWQPSQNRAWEGGIGSIGFNLRDLKFIKKAYKWQKDDYAKFTSGKIRKVRKVAFKENGSQLVEFTDDYTKNTFNESFEPCAKPYYSSYPEIFTRLLNLDHGPALTYNDLTFYVTTWIAIIEMETSKGRVWEDGILDGLKKFQEVYDLIRSK